MNDSDKADRLLDDAVITRAAEKLLQLPDASKVDNATLRQWRGTKCATTLADLWKKFVECGFSTLEPSDATDPLGLFVAANGPILHLDRILGHGENLGPWVEEQLAASGLRRMRKKKQTLIEGNLPHFVEAGRPDDSLDTLCQTSGALRLFCDLARKTASDEALPLSGSFSAQLDPTLFPQIGHKQLRNILVNTGLAVNVVPLDSRWKRFFNGIVMLQSSMFQRKRTYLALEDILRQALIRIQPQRPDLANLAIVDAVVFATIKSET